MKKSCPKTSGCACRNVRCSVKRKCLGITKCPYASGYKTKRSKKSSKRRSSKRRSKKRSKRRI